MHYEFVIPRSGRVIYLNSSLMFYDDWALYEWKEPMAMSVANFHRVKIHASLTSREIFRSDLVIIVLFLHFVPLSSYIAYLISAS